jgi:hypothetical protein
MVKRKYPKKAGMKGMKSMMGMGLGAYGSAMAMGALPTMGIPAAESVKSSVGGGLANFSGVFPAVGSLYGAGMVVGASKGLMGATKGLTAARKKRRRK